MQPSVASKSYAVYARRALAVYNGILLMAKFSFRGRRIFMDSLYFCEKFKRGSANKKYTPCPPAVPLGMNLARLDICTVFPPPSFFHWPISCLSPIYPYDSNTYIYLCLSACKYVLTRVRQDALHIGMYIAFAVTWHSFCYCVTYSHNVSMYSLSPNPYVSDY